MKRVLVTVKRLVREVQQVVVEIPDDYDLPSLIYNVYDFANDDEELAKRWKPDPEWGHEKSMDHDVRAPTALDARLPVFRYNPNHARFEDAKKAGG